MLSRLALRVGCAAGTWSRQWTGDATRRSCPAPDRFDTAEFYGADVDAGASRYWLFLERVPGRPLTQIGEIEAWCAVATWLAGDAIFATPIAAVESTAPETT